VSRSRTQICAFSSSPETDGATETTCSRPSWIAREAGVIVNDNIAQFNGAIALLPAVIDEKERVTIEVTA